MGCHFLLQGIFLTQGSNLISCISCLSSRFFTTEPTWEPQSNCTPIKINLPKAMGRFKSLNSSLILLEYASKPPEEAYDLRGIDHTAEVCSVHGSCYETAYFCLSFCFFLTLHTFLMYTQTL